MGLALAVLVAVGPAMGDEVTAGAPPSPWHRLSPGGSDVGFQPDPAGLRDLPVTPFFLRRAERLLSSRGLFFDAAEGLRIGAQGSFNPGSGNLRAIVCLKLEF